MRLAENYVEMVMKYFHHFKKQAINLVPMGRIILLRELIIRLNEIGREAPSKKDVVRQFISKYIKGRYRVKSGQINLAIRREALISLVS